MDVRGRRRHHIGAAEFLGSDSRSGQGHVGGAGAREENAYTLGVQAYLWGVPFVEYGKTVGAALKAGATHVNSFRRFTTLKTAKDRYVVTPNNVTLDGYAAFDVTDEPAVLFVPKLAEERWYIVQLGDHFDEIFHNVGGTKGPQPRGLRDHGTRLSRGRTRRDDASP